MKQLKIKHLKALYSRGALLAFALLYSFFAVIGSTFSWITSANNLANQFSGDERLDTILYEIFEPNMNLRPGDALAKEISAFNSGTVDMVVRLAFEEQLQRPLPVQAFNAPGAAAMLFPEYCNPSSWANAADVFPGGVTPSLPSGLNVKTRQLETLVGGSNRYEHIIYYGLGNNQYQRVTASFETRIINGEETLAVSDILYWGYAGYEAPPLTADWRLNLPDIADGDDPRNVGRLIADAGQKIAINYNAAAFDSTAPTAGKWYYNQEDGFFYYIGKLEPGAFTPSLLEGFMLSADAPHIYSAMRLDFSIHLEAVSNAPLAVGEWGLAPGNAIYDALLAGGAFA